MRHKVFGNHLSRNTKQAKALYRSLVTELLEHGRIETTLPKAKAARAMVDRVITFAKKNSVNARREVVKILGGGNSLERLFGEIAPKMRNRNSGYTRIIRLGQRFSDTAEKVYLELVEGVEITPKPVEEKPKTEEKVQTTGEKEKPVAKAKKVTKLKTAKTKK